MHKTPRIKANRFRSFNLLLVEDNPGDIRLIEELLKESEYYVHLNYVQNGTDALDYLYKKGQFENATSPDLILLDLNIPKKDGRIVLKEIKSDPNLKKIPVIILTISQAEEDISQCYHLHANCYIQKPLEMDSFISAFDTISHFWLDTVSLPPREKKDVK